MTSRTAHSPSPGREIRENFFPVAEKLSRVSLRGLLASLLLGFAASAQAQDVPPSFRAPGWTEFTAAGSRSWTAIASNTDGTKLAATVNGGKVWTSSNGGATWTEQTASPTALYTGIASSSNGNVLAAVAAIGQIQVSTDGGATWNGYGTPGYRRDISVSSDGTKMATAFYGGALQLSTDSGMTWTNATGAGSRDWISVEISGDGAVVVGGVEGGQLYVSTDVGATWNAQATSRYWNSIASSLDGTKLAAASLQDNFGNDDGLYLSTDSGTTWTKSTTAGDRDWRTVSMSSDGTKLVAIFFSGGEIHTSTDSGATWTPRSVAGTWNWRTAAMSRDGGKCVAAVFGAQIHGAVPSSNDTVTVATGSGPQSVVEFLDSFDPGVVAGNPGLFPAFDISNDTNSLFTAQPNLIDNMDGTADLEFTPGNTVGTATVTFTVETRDVGLTTTATSATHRFRIALTSSNSNPTDITLDDSSIPENNAVGDLVGNLGMVDPDTGQTPTFDFAAGGGDNDDFTINGTQLKLDLVADFELKSSYEIRLEVTDGAGGSYEEDFTITVVNRNETPSFTVGGNQSVVSTSAARTVPGWATDIDDGDSTVIQTVQFTVTEQGASGLFTVLPAVSESGELTYTPNGNTGTATFDVTLTDDMSIGGDAAITTSVQTFTITITPQPPTVTSPTATGITKTGATLGGTITSEGGAPIYYGDRGVVVALASAAVPEVGGPSVIQTAALGGGIGQIAVVVGGLTEGTNYQYRAYATNAGGTGYSSVGTFTTSPGEPDLTIEIPAGTELPGSGVLAWGRNDKSQTAAPADLGGVLSVAAGYEHSLAVKSDGTVVAWGANTDRQSTIPSGLSGVVSVAAGAYHSLALKSDGTVVAWGKNNAAQATVPAGLTNVIALAAGAEHSVALKNDGTLVMWGSNAAGQRTAPTGLAGVKAIAAGGYHTLALKSDGTVVAFGRTDEGQSTVPLGLNQIVSIAAGAYHSLALRASGTVVAWGANESGQRSVPAKLKDVSSIAAGAYHSLAMKRDGNLVAWGWNGDGQGTVPTGAKDALMIAAGYAHSIAATGPSLDLGTVPLGKTSAAATVTIGNTGVADLTLDPPSVAGVQAADFAIASALSSPVAPAGTTSFDVTFTPSALGARSARVVVASNDPDENPTVVFVKGFGVAAPVAPTVTHPTSTGLTQSEATLGGSVDDDGGADLTQRGVVVAPPAVTGPFTLATPGVLDFPDTTLGMGLFTVDASGLDPATAYRFRGYAKNTDHTGYSAEATFTTTAPAPEITLEDPTVDFGKQRQAVASSPRTITVKNTGHADLTLGGISISGANFGDFAFNATGLDTSLDPGDSTTFTVTFTPSASGRRTASLSIVTNDTDENPATIPLEGIGEAALSGLTFGAGTLSPAFDPATLKYTLTLPATGSTLAVTPTAAGAGATITLNGTPATSGAAANLTPIPEPIILVVTSTDQLSARTYEIAVVLSASTKIDLTIPASTPGKSTVEFQNQFIQSLISTTIGSAVISEPETGPLPADPGYDVDLTIDGSNHPNGLTFENTGTDRLFHVQPGSRLTLIRCKLINGGGMGFTENGGAILNEGELVLIDCEFVNNTTSGEGGAIHSTGVLDAERVTFENNSASTGGAVKIEEGEAEIVHGTFTGNTGDAIRNEGLLDLIHCTIASNGFFGVVNEAGQLRMGGCIVWGHGMDDLAQPGGTFTDLGWNLIGGMDDPLLRPLSKNGGHTRTMALDPGSPALEIIGAEDAEVAFDQRGLPVVGDVDLGAYELQPLNYRWTTAAGAAYDDGSTDGPGPDARFSNPIGIVRADDGAFYVSDSENHTIRRIGVDGVVSTFAGSPGEQGTDDEIIGTDARFFNPAGLALDGEGNLYVADSGNHTIRRITPAGEVTTFAGNPTLPGSTDDIGTAAEFDNPRDLTFDDDGNLYVADTGNHTIRMITPMGDVSTLAGSAGDFGHSDAFAGGDARFDGPSSIAYSVEGYLYVADSNNNAIRTVTLAGEVTTVVDTGLNDPRGIEIDGAGNIYFTEFGSETIQVLTRDLQITTLGGEDGIPGAVDGDGTDARFNDSAHLFVTPGGTIHLADSQTHRIVRGDLITGLSSDAELLDLTLSDGELDPVFSPEDTEYWVAVPLADESIGIVAPPADEDATVTYDGNPVDPEDGVLIDLDPGPNPLSFVVTAANGVSKRTYSVVFWRMDPPVLEETVVVDLDGDTAEVASDIVEDDFSFFLMDAGFVYSEASVNPEPTLGGLGVTDICGCASPEGIGTTLEGLAPGIRYAVRAFAENPGGIGYSEFTTYFHTDTEVDLDGSTLVFDRDLLPGESQVYRFSLDARKVFRFNVGGSVSLRYEIYDAAGNLVASSEAAGDQVFENALSADDYTLVILRDAAPRTYAAEDYVLSFGTTVLARSRPDVAAGAKLTKLTGLLDYRAATLQLATIESKKARRVTGHLTVQNRGNLPDALRLRATKGDRFFKVSYFRGTVNETTTLIDGTFLTESIDSGDAALAIRCVVKPDRRKLAKPGKPTVPKTITLLLRAESTASSGPVDSAGLKVNTK